MPSKKRTKDELLREVERLRPEPATRELPIVCVSAKGSGDVQAEGFAAAATAT